MAFVQLDDATDAIEVIVFAKSWETARERAQARCDRADQGAGGAQIRTPRSS